MDAASVKVVIVGESSVGKSSIAQRFVKNEFDDFQETTVGAACLTKLVTTPQAGTLRLELWDTAGQERYRGMAPIYYRNAKIALVVYDMTNPASFEKAEGWIKELSARLVGEDGAASAVIALVGNKCDLPRAVTNESIERVSQAHTLVSFEVSAKTGDGIPAMFDFLLAGYLKTRTGSARPGSMMGGGVAQPPQPQVDLKGPGGSGRQATPGGAKKKSWC